MRTSMITAENVTKQHMSLLAGIVSTSASAKLSAGSKYLDSAEVKYYSVKFRVTMMSNSAAPGSECAMDLLDVNGVFSGGVPSVVAGSEIDTTLGLPPPGGPATSPTALSAYEADITPAFAGFAGAGVFLARIWSVDNSTPVIASEAVLIFG